MSTRAGPGAPRIDWAEVRRRLDAAAHVTEAGATGEAARAVLAERARLLARPVSGPAQETPRLLVTFRLGGETWGIEARYVWEVFKVTQLASLPGAGAPVAGITSWRGLILTALDPRPVLDIPTSSLDDLRFAMAVGLDRPSLAILADAVDEIRSLPEGGIEEPPEGVAVRREHLLGVTRTSLPVLDARGLIQRFG